MAHNLGETFVLQSLMVLKFEVALPDCQPDDIRYGVYRLSLVDMKASASPSLLEAG